MHENFQLVISDLHIKEDFYTLTEVVKSSLNSSAIVSCSSNWLGPFIARSSRTIWYLESKYSLMNWPASADPIAFGPFLI